MSISDRMATIYYASPRILVGQLSPYGVVAILRDQTQLSDKDRKELNRAVRMCGKQLKNGSFELDGSLVWRLHG